MRGTTVTHIEEATRAWAKGIYPIEAGVELLIRHGKAIRDNAPWIQQLESLEPGHPGMAAIDTEQLLEHTGAWSGSERRIVRIAASLIDGTPVNLNEDLPGLDRTNLTHVLAAIAHANGSHEHSGVVYDTNGSPTAFERLPSLYPWSQPLPEPTADRRAPVPSPAPTQSPSTPGPTRFGPTSK